MAPSHLLFPHGGGPLLAHTAHGHLDRGLELRVAPRRRVVGRECDRDVRLDPVVLDRPALAMDVQRVGRLRHARAVDLLRVRVRLGLGLG